MNDPVVTADLFRFRQRELEMAAELLTALTTPDRRCATDEGLTLNMDINGGCVFLRDENDNTYMMNGDQLEQFLCSPSDVYKGFYDELVEEYGDMHPDDKEWLIDHARDRSLAMTPAMLADDKEVQA